MHICSICNEEFETEAEYLDHTCTTDFKPTDFEHQTTLDPNYQTISDSALERGKKK
jgi:hypothetical protein